MNIRNGPDTLLPKPIVQLGYGVPDLDAAAARWVQAIGVGPFYFKREAKVNGVYRGKDIVFYNSSAFAQWGDVQIELTQQLDQEPSLFREVCPPGKTTLVSYGYFVEDISAEARRMHKLGYDTVFSVHVTGADIRMSCFDTRPTLGVLAEVYQENAALRRQYKIIADGAAAWDGERPMRDFSELLK